MTEYKWVAERSKSRKRGRKRKRRRNRRRRRRRRERKNQVGCSGRLQTPSGGRRSKEAKEREVSAGGKRGGGR